MSDEQIIKALNRSSYLKLIYEEIYSKFKNLAGSENIRVLEIGAGGTLFAKKYFKNVIISNFSNTAGNAERLEYEDNSFDLIISKDVLHHIKDLNKAFSEFNRVLTSKGKVIASEPSWSFLGSFVYKYLHPEPWYKSKEFILKSNDPWDSNQRLLRNLLELNNSELDNLIKGFSFKVHPGTYGLSYLFSGGVRKNRKLPESILIYMHKKRDKLPQKMLDLFQLNNFAVFQKLM